MCQWCVSSQIADRLTAGVPHNRRPFMAFTASFALVSGTSVSAQAESAADVIFRNGPIYPMTSAGGAKVEALAIASGKILASGTTEEVMARASASTRIVELEGRALFPGLIDPHNHTVLSSLFSALLIDIGFSQYKTKSDAVAAMKATAAKTATGRWMAFRFFDNLLQGGDLSMAELDAISTTSPIFVMYVNGHVGAGNSLAFEKAKIAADVGDLPGGGYFGRGADGKLNGLIYNEPALMRFVDIAVPQPTPQVLMNAITA
jgi:predicted amidohydrolase YtcJ